MKELQLQRTPNNTLVGLCFILMAIPVGTAQSANLATSTTAVAEELQVERDFDAIRNFQSYDPATDKWSKIEHFKDVELLEDHTKHPEDRYLYHNFWAYNVLTRTWHKVDIRNYGYKSGSVGEENQKEFASFWKNLALGFRLGAGATFYKNTIINIGIAEKNGKYYLLEQDSSKAAYHINWLGVTYEKEENFTTGTDKDKKDINIVEPGKKISFTGRGWNLPITLVAHYTFFKRLRIGGGGNLEINYLKELEPRKDARNLKTLQVKSEHEWFYNTSWFGMIGLNVMHHAPYDIVIDLQAGKNYNTGTNPINPINKVGYIYNGLLFSLGMAYEQRLNSYFKFLARVGVDMKTHDDTPTPIAEANTKASVRNNQFPVHLEIGIHFNFGKEKESAENLNNRKNNLQESKETLGKAKDKYDQLRGKIGWELLK